MFPHLLLKTQEKSETKKNVRNSWNFSNFQRNNGSTQFANSRLRSHLLSLLFWAPQVPTAAHRHLVPVGCNIGQSSVVSGRAFPPRTFAENARSFCPYSWPCYLSWTENERSKKRKGKGNETADSFRSGVGTTLSLFRHVADVHALHFVLRGEAGFRSFVRSFVRSRAFRHLSWSSCPKTESATVSADPLTATSLTAGCPLLFSPLSFHRGFLFSVFLKIFVDQFS